MKKSVFVIFMLTCAILAQDAFCCNRALLSQIRQLIQKECVFPTDLRRLARLECRDLNKGLKEIDPYARWYPRNSTPEAVVVSDRVGIGAILVRQGHSYWLYPYKNGPLYKKGVRGKVRLVAINKKKVDVLSYRQVWRMFLGPVNSMVRLDIVQHGVARWFYLIRSHYTPSSLELYKEKGRVVIRILRFDSRQTRIYLQEELLRIFPDTELVIDLQACPGGDLYEALDCAALFLPPGRLMARLEDARGNVRDIFVPSSLPSFGRKIKIVVGPDTASAAEIFAGILSFYGVGHIEGQRTRGKCTSQRLFVLQDGSRLRLSNLKIMFPDGSSCQGRGLYVKSN